MYVAADLLGWVASAILVGAFYARSDRGLFWALLAGLSLMAIHQLAIGAPTAAGSFALGALRVVALLRWPRSRGLTVLFCAATLASAALTYHGAASVLAAIGGLATTLSLYRFAGRDLRLSLLPANLVWIAHHVAVGSLPALVMEVAIMAGNALTAWRISEAQQRGARIAAVEGPAR